MIWELSVRKIDDHSCEYSNHIHGSAIDESIAFFKAHGISLEKAREARQLASDAYNREETPNFAKSLERKALSRTS